MGFVCRWFQTEALAFAFKRTGQNTMWKTFAWCPGKLLPVRVYRTDLGSLTQYRAHLCPLHCSTGYFLSTPQTATHIPSKLTKGVTVTLPVTQHIKDITCSKLVTTEIHLSLIWLGTEIRNINPDCSESWGEDRRLHQIIVFSPPKKPQQLISFH